jgi:DNA modification methylase
VAELAGMTEPVHIGDAAMYQGDCLAVLAELADQSVQCCVTSPPYFGLRDYGHAEQIGLEPSPNEYVAKLVEVFRQVRRVLKDDGVCWVNLGDSYGTGASGQNFDPASGATNTGGQGSAGTFGHKKQPSIKGFNKQILGIPWRVAFALQADGWYLRQDIIWAKPNPMPESVTDRCTKAHEYLFLLTKSARYYWDAEAIAEPVALSSIARLSQPNLENQIGSDRVPGKTNGNMKAVGRGGRNAFRGQGHFRDGENGPANREGRDMKDVGAGEDTRNRRSVWSIATTPFKSAHFAVMPQKLVEPCILAGSRLGDTVLDPFSGSGTVGAVATGHGRRYLGIELNPDYLALSVERLRAAQRQPDLFHEAGKAEASSDLVDKHSHN